ncbi:UNVERIFIED_CONTAM: hypothetical protein FKN15_067689, partial [Acipenser sinensis]
LFFQTVTESFGATIEGLKASHLTETVVERSKRMILDTLGVGLLGTNTSVLKKILQYSKVYNAWKASTVWGNSNISLLPQYAAFVNGVAKCYLSKASLPEWIFLLAFNVGIEVQGRLMRFSKEASNIPKRFHPPAVVGTMGSAAATSKLLHMGSAQYREVLAIAASYSGSPMANAATQTKSLHIGNAARRGLEASYLALLGLEGNKNILDMKSGFGAFYTDYTPDMLPGLDSYRWVPEDKDVAIKRFPAHLGMHWVADAATALRMKLLENNLPLVKIKKVVLKVPDARYVNRPFPASEHKARHSFQFNACTALVDGSISEESFSDLNLHRQEIRDLLEKVLIENPHDNHSNFDTMYCEVGVEMHTGETITERCNTFYGHWREPLSQYDLLKKFKANASTVLSMESVQGIIDTVANLEKVTDCTVLSSYLQVKEKPN